MYNRAWHTVGTQWILLHELNWNECSYHLASHVPCLQLNSSSTLYFMPDSENERVRDTSGPCSIRPGTEQASIYLPYSSTQKMKFALCSTPGFIDWATDCYLYNGSSCFWGWESHSSLNAVPLRKSYLFYQGCWEFISTIDRSLLCAGNVWNDR